MSQDLYGLLFPAVLKNPQAEVKDASNENNRQIKEGRQDGRLSHHPTHVMVISGEVSLPEHKRKAWMGKGA